MNVGAVLLKSRIVHGSQMWLVPSLEYFTLLKTDEDFEATFKGQCQLCSLLWSQACEEFTSNPSLELQACLVFLGISINVHVGPSCLSQISIVGAVPQAGSTVRRLAIWRYTCCKALT